MKWYFRPKEEKLADADGVGAVEAGGALGGGGARPWLAHVVATRLRRARRDAVAVHTARPNCGGENKSNKGLISVGQITIRCSQVRLDLGVSEKPTSKVQSL